MCQPGRPLQKGDSHLVVFSSRARQFFFFRARRGRVVKKTEQGVEGTATSTYIYTFAVLVNLVIVNLIVCKKI